MTTMVGTSIYGRGDLANILMAIDRTTDSLPVDNRDLYVAGYLAGHQAALAAVAMAIGVASPEPQPAMCHLEILERKTP